MREMILYVFGVAFGAVIAIAALESTYKQQIDDCQNQVKVYEAILNDPHHCVSIVVEALEGKDDISIK